MKLLSEDSPTLCYFLTLQPINLLNTSFSITLR